MKNKPKNPFDISVRNLNLYEKLQIDVAEESDNILDSLPQFLRMGLIEREAGWYSKINRFDMVVPFAVHGDFPKLNLIGRNINVCNKIKPQKTNVEFIAEHEFLTFPVIDLNGEFFTIQDFVLAIAYHGTFHLKTDKPHLEKLYTDFIQEYPELSFRLALEVGECFVDAFQNVYETFNGDNNAFSVIHGRQPQLDLGAKAFHYSNSYMQLPVRAKYNCGIRICLDIRLEESVSQGFIFGYGHREKDKISISCEQVTAFLLIKTKNNNFKGLNTVIKIPILDYMKREFFKLEVAFYKSGKFVVGIDEWLKDSIQIPTSFEIYDGKLVLGANLDGNSSGTFYNRALTLEAIDKRNHLTSLFKAGLTLLGDFPLRDLPANVLNRPAITPATKYL